MHEKQVPNFCTYPPAGRAVNDQFPRAIWRMKVTAIDPGSPVPHQLLTCVMCNYAGSVFGAVEFTVRKILAHVVDDLIWAFIPGGGTGEQLTTGGHARDVTWMETLNNEFIFAKLTSQDATKKWMYSWSEAQQTPTGPAIKSGGRTGTSAADPAMLPSSVPTVDLSTVTDPYVTMARSQPDGSGQGGWIICGPIGICGESTRWAQVTWDSGTGTMSQDSQQITYVCGLLVKVVNNDPTVIANCAGGSG